jgi:hypothetical protein
VADAHFEVPRLAEIYDPLDPDRSDLDAYAPLAGEFGARTVLDIGCGTGTLACLLASPGKRHEDLSRGRLMAAIRWPLSCRAGAWAMNPANDDTCHMRTRSHPGRPRARQRAGRPEV